MNARIVEDLIANREAAAQRAQAEADGHRAAAEALRQTLPATAPQPEEESGIPTGPIDREPLDYPAPGVYPDTARKAEILMDVFHAAGVDLGEYDNRIAIWLAQTADWSTFATVTSWVQRAGQPRA